MASKVTDENRMLLGAGFAFGAAVTLLLLGVAAVTIASRPGRPPMSQAVLATLAAGVFFAAVIGVTLYLLAFPENRVDLPVDWLPATAGQDDEKSPGE
jgi:hypothetical protein